MAASARACVVVLVALGAAAMPATAVQLVVEPVGATSQGFLYVDYRLERPFEGKALEAVRSGLPSTFTFTIEVWRQRTGWWDALKGAREMLQLRVLRDVLNQQYVLASRDEVRRFADLEALAAALARPRRQYLPETARAKTYYVVLAVNVAPLSVEDLKELEEWLQGTLRAGDEGRPGGVAGLSGTLVGLLLGVTGFGDETLHGRTPNFVPEAVLRAAAASPRWPGVAASDSGAPSGSP